MDDIRKDADMIIKKTIQDNLPYKAVENALSEFKLKDKDNIYILSIGKAAWTMCKAACDCLDDKIRKGIIITKYGHSQGDLEKITIIEAGHPITDENSIKGTEMAIDMANSLSENDILLFLISGGGSALFEKPLGDLTLDEIIDINNQLLLSGADIVEINMIRKRLSAVKAGRFAKIAHPAKVFTIVLSDVLGDRIDSIASGPAAADLTTSTEALKVIDKYGIKVPGKVMDYLSIETPKQIENVETIVTGSVKTLCYSAAKHAESLGYKPYILSTTMNCEAREAGKLIGSIAREINNGKYTLKSPCAVIFGGETVVHITGNGKGGRNQELSLAAANEIEELEDVILFSIGSDGTDGPTDAAGGIVDGRTKGILLEKGIKIEDALQNNDSYNALKAANALVITGPTGTNVNDLTVLLCK